MYGTLGEIRVFGGNFAPLNTAFCQGQMGAISNNQDLFSILGSIYGGDGRTSFALPDYRGRTPVGMGGRYYQGAIFGSERTTLTTANLPSHNHTVSFEDKTIYDTEIGLWAMNGRGSLTSELTGNYPAKPSGLNIYNKSASSRMASIPITLDLYDEEHGKINNINDIVTEDTGGSYPFSIMQPYIVVNYIICTKGVYPSRN